jgi:hypothetical protein
MGVPLPALIFHGPRCYLDLSSTGSLTTWQTPVFGFKFATPLVSEVGRDPSDGLEPVSSLLATVPFLRRCKMNRQTRCIRFIFLGALTFLPGALALAQEEISFIRGDANGDGVVSFADRYRIVGFVTGRFTAPDCMRSADVDANGIVIRNDANYLANYLLGTNEPPPSPFPNPGLDTAPAGDIDCKSYGSDSPLSDPAAALYVLDATSPSTDNGCVALRIVLSNTSPVSGFFGRVRVKGARFDHFDGRSARVGDLTDTSAEVLVRVQDGAVLFSVLSSAAYTRDGSKWILPGSDIPVLEIYVCLDSQTAVGEYPLTLEDAEIIDAESARAIFPDPAEQNSILTVLSDEPPPPPPPSKAVVTLGSGDTFPGGNVDVPLFIHSPGPIDGYSFSMDFDEEVLQGQEVEVVWSRPDGSNYDFQVFDINNSNAFPGNHGVDEGFIVGSVVFDTFGVGDAAKMPADTDNEALRFHFLVNPETTAAGTAVSFLDGGRSPDRAPTNNTVTVQSAGIDLEFVNGFITIQTEPVLRGDVNFDRHFDLSDPITVLAHLFQGGPAPKCPNAAEFNRDGRLDISDPVSMLGTLFLGAPPPGADQTVPCR